MNKHILIILLFATILSSCSIEKRVYQSGYYISGRNSSHDDLDIPQGIKPIAFEEPKTLEKVSEAVIVATEQYSTLTSNYSDSIIKDYNLSNIIQTNKILTKTYSDSIPDDGKVLLANYEKNHKTKMKIKKIGSYPLAVATCGFFMTWIIFLIYLFSSMPDMVLTVSLLIFAAAVILVIPFAIIYLILSIITKKQRRALRKMGLVK